VVADGMAPKNEEPTQREEEDTKRTADLRRTAGEYAADLRAFIEKLRRKLQVGSSDQDGKQHEQDDNRPSGKLLAHGLSPEIVGFGGEVPTH